MTRPLLVVLDAHYFWTQELFRNCTSEFDVLLLKPRDFRAQRRERGKLFYQRTPVSIGPGVWEQHLPMPPGWLFHFWFLTSRFLAYGIRKFSGKRQIILAYCYPQYASLTKQLKSKSLYYSIDDYHDYWPGREEETARLEAKCIQSVDAVIAVSAYRTALFQGIRKNEPERIFHLPHGCSTQFMVEVPLAEPLPVQGKTQGIARPICGYIGALNNRFDFAFLAQVATLLPNVQFVLGGDEPKATEGSLLWFEGYSDCNSLANIHFIGRVQHDEVGRTLQSFDVLLMPYAKCGFNTSACPMKLWDYMGTSRPVVANDAVPEVLLWDDVIRIGKTPAEFAEKIQESLKNPEWEAANRLRIARDNTWQKQGGRLCAFIRKSGLTNF